MLRHFWIVSGWQRYFWISVPLTHHYKKCPVMWTIIELISKNPEISLSSRNNPEMSQRSSDVPMLANFSIYIFPWDLLWTGLYRLKYIFFHWLQCFSLCQKLLTNRNCLNFLMFLQGDVIRFPKKLWKIKFLGQSRVIVLPALLYRIPSIMLAWGAWL